MLKQTKTFLADLWGLTRPYWFSEERWAARSLLAVLIALNLALVYIRVLINLWNNDFYNTLQNLDQSALRCRMGTRWSPQLILRWFHTVPCS